MMTKCRMDPVSYFPNTNSNWLLAHNKCGIWTAEENKLFENALAYFDLDTPDRWEKVAEMIPGKTVDDVINHYQELEDDVTHIEAGLIPLPGYSPSSFTLDWENNNGFDGLKQAYGGKGSAGRLSDQERKKGIPWTEEEHRLFLMGLKKYGKGDWRNISRNFVTSRTPTQVASHAQKYFIRLSSGGKDKRRSSIHDITTLNLPDSMPPPPSSVAHMADSGNSVEAAIAFNKKTSSSSSSLVQPSYTYHGPSPYEMKLQVQSSHKNRVHDPVVGYHTMLFQMQSARLYPHA